MTTSNRSDLSTLSPGDFVHVDRLVKACGTVVSLSESDVTVEWATGIRESVDRHAVTFVAHGGDVSGRSLCNRCGCLADLQYGDEYLCEGCWRNVKDHEERRGRYYETRPL